MSDVAEAVDEDTIRQLVRRFYALALADDLLGPMFRATIADLEAHMQVVDDFWSHVVLGTHRYNDHPYVHHTHLKVEPAHFDRWMAAFEQAVGETLPPAAAGRALGRARQMTASFKAGLLPLPKPPAA